MQHRIKRWQYDHTPELHTAWMNGVGMIVWENVFGSLVLWSERDKSILRSMVGIQRRYANLFSGEGWTPLIRTQNASVYASLWHDDTNSLWTIINSAETDVSGELLIVPHREGDHYYDLIAGAFTRWHIRHHGDYGRHITSRNQFIKSAADIQPIVHCAVAPMQQINHRIACITVVVASGQIDVVLIDTLPITVEKNSSRKMLLSVPCP